MIEMRKEITYEISQEQGPKIRWAFAEKSDRVFKNMETCYLTSFLGFANMFSSIQLVDDSIYVSHSNIISSYSLLDSEWISHLKLPAEIQKMNRINYSRELTT